MHACRFPSALFSEGWEKGKGGSIHPQGDIRDPLHIYPQPTVYCAEYIQYIYSGDYILFKVHESSGM